MKFTQSIEGFSMIRKHGMCLVCIVFLIGSNIAGCGSDKENYENRRRGSADGLVLSKKQDIMVPLLVGAGRTEFTTAKQYSMSLEGCSSGLHYANIDAPIIKVYKNDRNCLVKLNRFTYKGSAWVPSSNKPFTTWQEGDVAYFVSKESPNLSLKVTVSSQLDNPISGAARVIYFFSDIRKGSNQTVEKPTISDSHDIGIEGQDAPPFSALSVSFAGISESGSGKFIFTLECNSKVTLVNNELTCEGLPLSQVSYLLVKDIYSSALDIEQAHSLFTTETPTFVMEDDMIEASAGGTVNGGFRTKTGNDILLSPGKMHTTPNMILILSANGTSFRYFNVDIELLSAQ